MPSGQSAGDRLFGAVADVSSRVRVRADQGMSFHAVEGPARARGDRGAMNIVIIPVVAALVFAAIFLIRNVGGGVDDSRQARTAADAAALAAAGVWSDSIQTAYYAALGSQEAYQAFVGRRLSSFATPQMRDRANYFAAQNGGTVVSYTVNENGTVTVGVRDDRTIPDTGHQAEHQSTARIRFDSGACLLGSQIGYLTAGTCATSVPRSDPGSQGPISRPDIISRGHYWVDKNIPYNQGASYPDPDGHPYRTDCSGFVSMAWHLSSSRTTQTLDQRDVSTRIGWDQLQAGDALVYNDSADPVNGSHVVLFVGWASSTTINVLEEAGSVGAVASVHTQAELSSYIPIRYNKVDGGTGADDTVNIGTTSGGLGVYKAQVVLVE